MKDATYNFWADIAGKIRRFFSTPCMKCFKGRVYHDRTEWTGRTWIEVYRCDKCGEEYV